MSVATGKGSGSRIRIMSRTTRSIRFCIAGLRYKVDRNHDLVYLELEDERFSSR